MEAIHTKGFILIACLALSSPIQEEPIATSLALLCGNTNLTILLNFVTNFTLNAISYGSEVHLIVASEARLIVIACATTDMTLQA